MTEALLAADTAARITALTALDRTLLVEAGAGSGKTSVLAGRVAALLAAGRPTREIAAITFTELAAGELRQRVVEFVTELADGVVRPDLRAAFPAGPDARRRATAWTSCSAPPSTASASACSAPTRSRPAWTRAPP
jgi:hypothetical protein